MAPLQQIGDYVHGPYVRRSFCPRTFCPAELLSGELLSEHRAIYSMLYKHNLDLS